MGAWYRSWKAGIGLRGLGVILFGVSYVAISHLVALHPPAPPRAASLLAYALATIGFVAGSAGSALLILGPRLFEEIAGGVR